MSGLVISQIGNFHAPFSSESDWKRSLEDLGHTVHPFEEKGADFLDILSQTRALDADLLIWTRTPGHHTDRDSQRALLSGLKRARIPSVAIHLDRYFDLKREDSIHEDVWWRTDLVATADGGNQDRFKAAGIRHHWYRPGVYASSCDMEGHVRNEFTSDVAFVGSWHAYHEEWPYRRELLSFLTQTYRRRFRPWPRGARTLRGQDLNDLYASVKVVVGDTIFADTAERYWSDRAVETIGRGGFLIHPYVKGMEQDFRHGEHIIYYETGDFLDLKHLIDYYLRPEHDAERRKIAEAGRIHVREHHTYAHRLQEVLDVLSGDKAIRQYDATPRPPAPYVAPPPPPSTAPPRPIRTRPPRISRAAQSILSSSRGPSDDMAVKEVFDLDAYHLTGTVLTRQTVVDIGANIGAFALRACELGAAKAICYEPLPSNAAHLRLNVAQSGGYSTRVFVHNAAVGAAPGVAHVHEGANATYSGSWTTTGEGLEVPQVSLNDILYPLPDVGFLKIDTEGAEYDILATVDPDLLARCRRIAIEFHAGFHAPSGRDIDWSSFGDIVIMLAEVFFLEIQGHPSRGCMVFGVRH